MQLSRHLVYALDLVVRDVSKGNAPLFLTYLIGLLNRPLHHSPEILPVDSNQKGLELRRPLSELTLGPVERRRLADALVVDQPTGRLRLLNLLVHSLS